MWLWARKQKMKALGLKKKVKTDKKVYIHISYPQEWKKLVDKLENQHGQLIEMY